MDQQPSYSKQIYDILTFLFEYHPLEVKQQLYPHVVAQFQQLDLAANYLLFSLVEQKLRRRAKMLFIGEDYQGKRDSLLEVFSHLAQLPLHVHVVSNS